MMIAELERQAAEMGPGEDGVMPTAVDVVCEYIAAGADEDGTPHTLAELGRILTEKTGQTISTGIMSSWLNSTSENKAKVAAARALAAQAQVQINNTVVNAADRHLAAIAERKRIKATAQPMLPAPEGADYELLAGGEESND